MDAAGGIHAQARISAACGNSFPEDGVSCKHKPEVETEGPAGQLQSASERVNPAGRHLQQRQEAYLDAEHSRRRATEVQIAAELEEPFGA